ncbi:hypothetical protein [Aeromicrobium terrae]|uniref:DUF3040 domain-containing protein n=1 Tax=Aeromicrobium terrae TaxID=2498846 RepID=A0A5C8NNY9_9ACTN|nr:hypothetical protein [Aeromicrobium terrae]TXL62817.1 hypothetical protein FHP06_00795 [Aeromicrobium terrae]
MPEPDDEFDEIVQGLDLDLSFPDDPPRPPPAAAPSPEPVDFDDLPDEPFYRRVTPPPPRPPHRGRTAAWIAVLGSPVAIMLATFLHVWLARPVLLGIGLIFVAGAIYLISQLPEHGPSRPDWPDDGAAL